MTTLAPDTAPAVLENLIAAGLVDHEVIGDPSRLETEAAVLGLICTLVAGPIYRLEPYHYAFPLRAADLEGGLDAAAPETWGPALATALGAVLGPEAVWVNATDLVPKAEVGQGADRAADRATDRLLADQPLLLLRAWGAAAEAGVAQGLETMGFEAMGPDLRAVIDARYAAETARLTAGLTARLAAEAAGVRGEEMQVLEGLGARLERLEAGLARLETHAEAGLARLETQAEAGLARLETHAEAGLARLGAQEAGLARLEAQVGQAGQAARGGAEGLAALGRAVEELAMRRNETAAFEERIGLALAEFLARIETGSRLGRPSESTPQSAPQSAPGRAAERVTESGPGAAVAPRRAAGEPA